MINPFVKRIGGDIVLSVAGISLMNFVIQFALYPFLTNKMGAGNFGVVLYLLSIVSVMGTFGTSANYSRMVVSSKQKCTNGDYNTYLSVIFVLCLIVSFVALHILNTFTVTSYIGYTILMCFSVLRYYGDVQFRLTIDFKGFFFYYFAVSIGYLIGILLYILTNSWILAILAGEIFAFVFVFIRGNIYRSPYYKVSENFCKNIKSASFLSGSNIISSLVQNADRILILFFIGSYEVTVFYAATLIGKVVALLTIPLNGVLISYLTKYNGRVTKKFFSICIAVALGSGIIALTGGVAFSYLAVNLLYPEVFYEAKHLFLLANAGQIMFFLSGILLTIVLKFADEKYQFYINMIYLSIFASVVIPCVALWGLWGISYGILIVNIVRFAMIGAIGFRKAHMN